MTAQKGLRIAGGEQRGQLSEAAEARCDHARVTDPDVRQPTRERVGKSTKSSKRSAVSCTKTSWRRSSGDFLSGSLGETRANTLQKIWLKRICSRLKGSSVTLVRDDLQSRLPGQDGVLQCLIFRLLGAAQNPVERGPGIQSPLRR